jgi:ATP diphosphatase
MDPIHAAPPGLDRLAEIMRRLRDPEGGCPWDVEQTHESIAPYAIEEAHEVVDAIERGDWDELRLELGDLLLQVVYHARMAEEAGRFDLAAIVEGISAKMIARHPHVFEDDSRDRNAGAQSAAWEDAKAAERAGRGAAGALDGVPLGLPALTRAAKLQRRAARVGFDWAEPEGAAEKVAEEAGELARAGTPEEVAGELGDLLFAVVNLARMRGVDPEAALRGTNAKFQRRFAFIEAALAEAGRRPEDATLEEMDALWDAAKLAERGG